MKMLKKKLSITIKQLKKTFKKNDKSSMNVKLATEQDLQRGKSRTSSSRHKLRGKKSKKNKNKKKFY